MLYQSAYEVPQDHTADVMTLEAAGVKGRHAGAEGRHAGQGMHGIGMHDMKDTKSK